MPAAARGGRGRERGRGSRLGAIEDEVAVQPRGVAVTAILGAMAVLYGSSRDLDMFQLAKLLADGGWREGASDLAKLAEHVRGSTRIAWATENHRLIGFASALTDGAFFGFVSQVVVHADCQGRGVEEALVDRLLKGLTGVTFVMRATPATAPFCATLGFRATDALCHMRKG